MARDSGRDKRRTRCPRSAMVAGCPGNSGRTARDSARRDPRPHPLRRLPRTLARLSSKIPHGARARPALSSPEIKPAWTGGSTMYSAAKDPRKDPAWTAFAHRSPAPTPACRVANNTSHPAPPRYPHLRRETGIERRFHHERRPRGPRRHVAWTSLPPSKVTIRCDLGRAHNLALEHVCLQQRRRTHVRSRPRY